MKIAMTFPVKVFSAN